MIETSGNKGYALLAAILAINIFAILSLMSHALWETEIQRDLEEEMIFRARQYVMAIDLYKKKNRNLAPKSLEMLYDKKFLRQLYPDPKSADGEWNLVMRSTRRGSKNLLIVRPDLLAKYLDKAQLIGVCSTSVLEGFRVYRGKKNYFEWAIYSGENIKKKMPKLIFVTK